MTTQMFFALAILVLMVVMIMTDKFSFGAPPLLACALLVITGTASIADAFKGFLDTNVVMIAGFMAVTAALQKTTMMARIQKTMSDLAAKGGIKSYILCLLLVMLGASFTAGISAYYVMIITLAATIPYSKGLPNSKLVMPLGFAAGRALIPYGVAFFMGLAQGLLDSSGSTGEITLGKFGTVVMACSVVYFIWALIAYKFLPDHDVMAGGDGAKDMGVDTKFEATLPKWKETCVYLAFFISAGLMLFAKNYGEIAYIAPGLASAFLCAIGVFNFKELRGHIFSPMVIMMGSVIGVASALTATGFNELIGGIVAEKIGGNVNYFVLTLIFCLLTTILSTVTGATIGSLFVFAPIGIAACMSMGMDPTGLAVAVTLSVFAACWLPLDGQPVLIFGMGKYTLKQFMLYAVPMWLLQQLALAAAATMLFPA